METCAMEKAEAWQEQAAWFGGPLCSGVDLVNFSEQPRDGSRWVPRTEPSVPCRLQERRGLLGKVFAEPPRRVALLRVRILWTR